MRRKIAILSILFLVVIFIQSFLGAFSQEVFLNVLVMAFAILAAICWELEEKFTWIFFLLAGLLADLFLFYPFGLNLLTFFLLATVFKLWRDKIFDWKEKKDRISLVFFLVGNVILGILLVFLIGETFKKLGVENFANWKPQYFERAWGSNLLGFLIFVPLAFLLVKKTAKFLDSKKGTLIVKR